MVILATLHKLVAMHYMYENQREFCQGGVQGLHFLLKVMTTAFSIVGTGLSTPMIKS